jgi:ribosomal protein L7/L12
MQDLTTLTTKELHQMIEEAQEEIRKRKIAISSSNQTLKLLVKQEYESSGKGKLPAIKLYKELTGEGLAEAKLIVEAWANYNRWFNPMP